jgi:hypothetical protein
VLVGGVLGAGGFQLYEKVQKGYCTLVYMGRVGCKGAAAFYALKPHTVDKYLHLARYAPLGCRKGRIVCTLRFRCSRVQKVQSSVFHTIL